MTDTFDSFSDLLRAALGDRLIGGDDILDLFVDDVIFAFPFAPDVMPDRIEGKEALAAHLRRLGPLLEFGKMTLRAVHHAERAAILEFDCDGRGIESGAPYRQSYVSVVALRNGRIAHYRDYWNPLVLLSALGGRERLAAAGFGMENGNGG